MIRKILFLEVRRGRTEFPLCPVLSDRFLIGGHAGCDLYLQDQAVPALHSIVYSDGSHTWLEAVVGSPPLKVNGSIEQTVCLRDGDVVEIGAFQFLACQSHVSLGESGEAGAGEEETDLENLSAAELVERIEAEQQLVEQFEARRHAGAEALLQAALEQSLSPADENLRDAA